MGGSYFFGGSNLGKYGTFWKNGCFSGRIWPDWGNTTPVDLAGLGSIGLRGPLPVGGVGVGVGVGGNCPFCPFDPPLFYDYS